MTRKAEKHDRVLAVLRDDAASLLRLARVHSICAADAEDAYQRALVIFLERVDRVVPETAGSWLRTVVKHEAMALRAARQRVLAGEEVDFDGFAADLDDGDAQALRFDRVTRAAEALQRCKADEVTALMLKAEGHSYDDDNETLRNADRFVSQFGVTYAVPAGNEGPAQSVNSPCIAYNTLCVGGFQMQSVSSPTDDTIPNFSSRGPSPGGRKKPDLVAVADSVVANQHWIRDCNDPDPRCLWTANTGTSFAAPQVAGAAALLAGAGVADPLAQKAILLTSTRLGRATPQSAMGTQTGWQPDWGWGALDLEQALQVKTNFFTDDVEGDQVRFFRSTAQAAGERATLVWNRRNIGCIGAGCGDTNSQNFKLSNLDLIARDAATGQVVASSTSTIDNVEQVRSTASGDLVYVVRAVGPVEGPDPVDAEPFALAARRQVFPLEAPRPSVALGSTPAVVQPGVDVTVQATIANPSSDLTGENVQATLELPAGVQLAPGSAPATVALGTLSKDGTSGDEAVVTWIVRGTADGLHRLEIRATSTRYGETMSRDVARDLLVDGTAPELTLDVSAGGRDDAAIPVSWTAADAGLANTLLEVSTDNGAFAPWRTDPAGAATYPGEAGRTYVFRLVASDTAGNIASTTSGVVTVNRPVATVTPTATPTVPAEPRVPSGLRIRSTTFTRTRVTVSGSVSGGVTGTVRATFTARAGGRTRTVTRTATLRGRFFTLRLPLPRALRAARRGRITVSYAGPARYLPATATRTLRRR